jgi:MFS family permease
MVVPQEGEMKDGVPSAGLESSPPAGNRARLILVLLAMAQFVMVIDSTVMNVSIVSLVNDLDATVTQIQSAVTFFTLVMAAAMISGGKLGDILGRRNAFRLGLLIYAAGSGLTAVATNIGMLFLGWSLLEGLGAALIMPTIAALVAGNFEGRARAAAYAVIASSASAAATLGPLIGGAVTTALSWRWVFAAEVLICVVILVSAGVIADPPRVGRPRFDLLGACLSAAGLAGIVLGTLQVPAWGLILPKEGAGSFLGLSLSFWLITGGLGLLWLFILWELRRQQRGDSALVDPGLLRNVPLVSGLRMLAVQGFFQAGFLFALPLFLSVVLGLSAFRTGLALMPLSITLILGAVVVARFLAGRGWGPRQVVRLGLVSLLAGTLLTLVNITSGASAGDLAVPLLFIGLGLGLLASQLGNLIVSSVPLSQSSEAGGLQFTAQNLGSSMGTAMVGAVLIAGLTSSLLGGIDESPAVSQAVKEASEVRLVGNVQFVSDAQLEAALATTSLATDEQRELLRINSAARVDALRKGIALMAVLVVAGLLMTSSLPGTVPGRPEDEARGKTAEAEPSGLEGTALGLPEVPADPAAPIPGPVESTTGGPTVAASTHPGTTEVKPPGRPVP